MSTAVHEVVGQFMRLHPGEVARQMESAAPEEVAAVLAVESPQTTARVLGYLQGDYAATVLSAAGEKGVDHLVSGLDPAHAANLLARLPEETRSDLLGALSTSLAQEIKEILAFPPGTAGQIMDARVAVFTKETSVRDALERIQKLRNRRISDLVVVDDEGAFSGVVRLQDVVGAAPDQQLAELK
ncbi:MAG: CBS domain-containing protein, partial [Polyangiales bacterium]